MNKLIAEVQSKKKSMEIDAYTNWLKLQSIPKHKISYLDFGDTSNKNIIICAHGLTRNAYDFGKIAKELSELYRVIAISYPGRGDSAYFADKSHYNYQVYMRDSLLILEKLNISSATHNIIWLGTSMGGIIGMALASRYQGIFKAMILNDIGPFIPAETLARIIKYAGQKVYFDDLDDAKRHLQMIYSQFGIKDEEDWDYLTYTSFELNSSGKYRMNYDTDIVEGLEFDPEKLKDVEFWAIWQKITCPMLVIHGAMSNILQQDTIKKMRQTRDFDLYVVKYAGHAPALMTNDQISFVGAWINNLV